MWIEKKENKDGSIRFVYYERYNDHLTGKQRRVSVSLNSQSRTAVKQATLLLQEKIAKVTASTDINKTLADIVEEWLAYSSPALKPATIRNNRQVARKLLQLLPQDILIIRINVSILQGMLNSLYYDDGRSYGYVRRFHILLNAVFKYAKRMRYIDNTDAVELIELKQKPKTIEEVAKARDKFLTRDELKSALQQLDVLDHRLALAMEFVALTGLRFGELVAIRMCDYDRRRAMLDINGTIANYVSNSSDAQRGTPKNIYSMRKVLLDNRATAIINYFIMDNNRLPMWQSQRDRGYIFVSRRGNPINNQYANRILNNVTITGKHLSTHIFRHTHISMLAELNIPLKSIMERVGHNDPRTTLSVYTHVSDQAKKDVITKLNTLHA